MKLRHKRKLHNYMRLHSSLHSSLRRSLGAVFKSGFIVETDGNGVKHWVKMLPEKRTECYAIIRKMKHCLSKINKKGS